MKSGKLIIIIIHGLDKSREMKDRSLQTLKREIQSEAKNGVDFILAAGVLWLVITFVWSLEYTAYNKSVLTFIVGAALLPLALGLSKLLKTNWKVQDNPLQPLGLWLNFAQLIYFPFLIFILIKDPDYFIMTYGGITGAHLFPYAWLYDEAGYAVCAVVISFGVLCLALNISVAIMWVVPLFTAALLFLLAGWIFGRGSK